MKRIIKSVARRFPGLGGVLAERDWLRRRVAHLEAYKTWRLPGHFYSPIPDLNEVRQRHDAIFSRLAPQIAGIDLRRERQLEWLACLGSYYHEFPFTPQLQPKHRFYLDNPYFGYSDALFHYGVLRHLRPRRLIEIGSGFSSALTLDVRDQFLGGLPQCTFIEPYPQERLNQLLRDSDRGNTCVLPQKVQETDPTIFESLEAGDICFIDSSHVSKTGSDVNFLFFDILPRLRPGVWVHVHDIFFPFEYPERWVYDGWAWNESYLLRAFLQYNHTFQIELFTSYLHQHARDAVATHLPDALKSDGQSLWMSKTI